MKLGTPLEFHAQGKLLITGEYAVLDGALALAVPTKKGQSMRIQPQKEAHPSLTWRAFDVDHQPWLQCSWAYTMLDSPQAAQTTPEEKHLLELLHRCQWLNPLFNLAELYPQGVLVETYLDFNRAWGWGTSSTLLHLLGQWAQVSAWDLAQGRFSGSGYDLACAAAQGPIHYQLTVQGPKSTPMDWKPPFADQLHLVYLEQKQQSQSAIAHYRAATGPKQPLVDQISRLTVEMTDCQSTDHWNELVSRHEQLLASLLQVPTARERWFADYPGSIKSLGAWGGDFVLACGPSDYFKAKGFTTCLPFAEVVRFH